MKWAVITSIVASVMLGSGECSTAAVIPAKNIEYHIKHCKP